MKIKILASDSMGVRSMCTLIETVDLSVLIDPSCALGPLRNKLYPHCVEIENLIRRWNIIKSYIKKSEILIFTHYHYDHHNPREVELYAGKNVFLKAKEGLNKRQRLRAERFFELLSERNINVKNADGRVLKNGAVELFFSEPLPHGKGGRQGKVIGVGVKHGNDVFLYTSDVQGFINDGLKNFIYKVLPRVIFMDGPCFYMLSKEQSEEYIDNMVKEILEIKKSTGYPEVLILDHHSMRGKDWEDIYPLLRGKFKKMEIEFMCSAEYENTDVFDYEAKRRKIYEKNSFSCKKMS